MHVSYLHIKYLKILDLNFRGLDTHDQSYVLFTFEEAEASELFCTSSLQ